MFISDTTVAVAIDDVKRGLWFLCQCFMRRQPEPFEITFSYSVI